MMASKPKIAWDKLANPDDWQHIVPIHFVWDYMPPLAQLLVSGDHQLELSIPNRLEDDPMRENSFPINPKAAGLPLHTGMTWIRHNRFWRTAFHYTSELVGILAADEGLSRAKVAYGKSLASVSEKLLRQPLSERFFASALNLFPAADEQRMALIAAAIILVTTFDGISNNPSLPRALRLPIRPRGLPKWSASLTHYFTDVSEDVPDENLKAIQIDFVTRIQNEKIPGGGTADSPLQSWIDDFARQCHACDEQSGTSGGHDLLETMLRWVMNSPAAENSFCTPREYLDFRWKDAANLWLAAVCKFSVRSNVSLTDPLLAKITRLCGDHESIVNDLASFEKEYMAFTAGQTRSLVNIVQVLQETCGIVSVQGAKSVAYTLQLLVEHQIIDEVERLKEQGGATMTPDHWRYIEALLAMNAGNVFYCMTTSRYGGEASRVTPSQSEPFQPPSEERV